MYRSFSGAFVHYLLPRAPFLYRLLAREPTCRFTPPHVCRRSLPRALPLRAHATTYLRCRAAKHEHGHRTLLAMRTGPPFWRALHHAPWTPPRRLSCIPVVLRARLVRHGLYHVSGVRGRAWRTGGTSVSMLAGGRTARAGIIDMSMRMGGNVSLPLRLFCCVVCSRAANRAGTMS